MARIIEVARFIGRSGKRIAVTVAGAVLLAGGLVMMVTPGPGILLIIAGLAVLATEYVWARTMLDKVKERASRAKDKVTRRRPRRQTDEQPSAKIDD